MLMTRHAEERMIERDIPAAAIVAARRYGTRYRTWNGAVARHLDAAAMAAAKASDPAVADDCRDVAVITMGGRVVTLFRTQWPNPSWVKV